MASHKELFFTRFERFWHWAQAFFILVLLFTGFEVAQVYTVLGYADATHWHGIVAWSLICLWIFTIFWHAVTGEWQQYRWTTHKLGAMIRYYTMDIFSKKIHHHPFKRSRRFKHNPLQRITYRLLSMIILPLIGVSGVLYAYYSDWALIHLDSRFLSLVAAIHLCMAFAMLTFMILHVYMAFTGTPLMSQLWAMFTGYVVIEDNKIDNVEEFHILLVTGDTDFAGAVSRWLHNPPKGVKSILLEHAVDLAGAVRFFSRHSYDMVIFDLELVGGHFLDSIEKIRALNSDIPMVVFSDAEACEDMKLVMRKGVQDFLVKQEIGRSTLIRVIQHALFRVRFEQYTQG